MFEWYVFKFIVSIEYRFQKGHLYNKWQYLVGLQSFFATNHFAANFYIVFEEFVQKDSIYCRRVLCHWYNNEIL